MKKQTFVLSAFLLTCVLTVLAAMPGLNAFVQYTATFVVAPEGAGTVSPASVKALAGTETASVTATANAGYTFDGWYVGEELVSAENPHKFVLTADVTVTARFREMPANVVRGFIKPGCEGMGTVSVSPEGTPADGGRKFNHGTQVTLKATPAKGHQFLRWEDGQGTALSQASTYSFTLTEDRTVYAVFALLENYHADLVAFPGCEGYGRFTTGGRMVDGRGAKVYYVTRLDDTGDEGTMRWACTTGDDTPRTVLFKVSGTIFLTSNLTVRPNTTIAGQTAPGGGICLAGYRVKLSSNTIVRHIRFRAGDLPSSSMSPLGVENVQNVVIDHCSVSWSMEENMTLYDCDYTTVQWCIFSEGLYDSRNSKGNRAYGAQWGGEHATMHHCLFAHNNSRSPRFNGVRDNVHDRHVDNEFINNVIYNWGSVNAVYGGECSTTGASKDTDYNRVYMIGNYYKPGPATRNATGSRRYWVSANGGSISEVGQWYLKGNRFELSSKWAPSSAIWSNAELEKVNDDNYYGFVNNNSSRAMNFWSLSPSQALADKALLTELPAGYQLTMASEPAEIAYQKVVLAAGASMPRYDEVDVRILSEAAGQQNPQFGGARGAGLGIIDSPTDITLSQHDTFAALYEGDKAADNREVDVTCYPRLQGDSYDMAVRDADGDGLPDAYETQHGLNPADGTDGMLLSASGYSHLEVFLNAVANGEIDAKTYTRHQSVTAMNRFNAIVAQDGSGNYTTIQEAVSAASGVEPFYIFVKAGEYHEHVAIDKSNVHLTGQSKAHTVIWDNKANNDDGGVDKAATINVTGNDVSFDNLTIRNTRTDKQAVALYSKGDRIVVTSCNLEGWQDTYRTGKDGQRHLIRNSKVAGKTDFIYGAGEVWFDADTLHVLEGGYIVAPDHNAPRYGYVFSDAVITARSAGSVTYLGRPWGNTPKVAYLNTRLTEGISIQPQGWAEMEGKPVQMAEYRTCDANGNLVDLSQRRTSFGGVASKAVLTPVEVNSYRLDYALRGTDDWDADWQGFILPAPQLTVSGGTLSWTDVTGFAQCYLVIADGEATITTATSRPDDGKQVTVQAVSAYGVCGDAASSASAVAVSTPSAASAVVSRQYFTPDGRPVSRLQHGVTVVRETRADGSIRSIKVTSR